MMSADFEPRRDRAPLPQRPNYLRVVFKKDDDGGVVKGEDGRRSIAAVEHVASGEVIHIERFDLSTAEEQSAEIVTEPVEGVSEAMSTETILLEN